MAGIDDEQQIIVSAPTIQGLMEEIDNTTQRWIAANPDALILFVNNIDGSEWRNDGSQENRMAVISEGFNPMFRDGNWHQAVWMSPE
jgi:hypothetical protein